MNPKFTNRKKKEIESTIETGMVYHIECSTRHLPQLTLNREELDTSLRHHRFFLAINREKTRIRFFSETTDINMLVIFLNNDTPYNNLILLIDGHVEQPYNVWEDYQQNFVLFYQKVISRQISGHPRQVASIRIIDSASINDTHLLWNAVYVPIDDDIE